MKEIRWIVTSVFAAGATCIASATAFAWGLETNNPGNIPDFVEMTRQSDFIGRWSYVSDDTFVIIEVQKCSNDLCVRRVLPSGVCSNPIMIVHENKNIPRRQLENLNNWHFSGNLNWINGIKYEMLADVIGENSARNGRPPIKKKKRLLFDGGSILEGRENWGGGLVYPVQFILEFMSRPICAP